MILHLLTDEKFTDYVLKQFSEPEMCSDFVLVSYNSHLVYATPQPNMRVIRPNSKDFQILLNHLNDYNAVVLHGLFFPWQGQVLRVVPATVKVAWVFWGGDIYGRKDIFADYLSSSSKTLLFIQQLKRRLKCKKTQPRYEVPFELLKRIDFCLTDVPEDFEFVKGYLKTGIKELWYNYYSVEETIGNLESFRCNGNNILVGNSSSLECNHLDGLRAVRRLQLAPEVKVYVPLSYGESWLRKEISYKGHKMLGNCFHPLSTFLARDEYNQIIRSCSVAIMPHYRPQAFGNILTALWLGTRVYLSSHNSLYPFFKRIGAIIFSLEADFDSSNEWALKPLSDEETEINRHVISSLYSSEEMYRKNLFIVQTLDS